MPRHAALKLEAMTVSQLLQLRDKVQTALSGKIQTERQELQRKIDELSVLEGSGGSDVANAPPVAQAKRRRGQRRGGNGAVRGNGRTHPLKGRTVAPKYRDPDNSEQTWAGRGQTPKWLAAYENEGRRREEFLIGAGASPRGKGRKRR
jgi:DNA-binding protein H-NS